MRSGEVDFKFKIVIVGDASVGKSCLIRRFGTDEFTELNATIGVDFIVKMISVDGFNAKLQVWDTAGQERFRTIITGYYRGSDAIIFVFDKSKRETFEHIDEWVFEVSQYNTENSFKVLVGNKADMQCVVSNEEALEKAKTLGYTYFDASAKNDVNVSSIFYTITRTLIQKNKDLGVIACVEDSVELGKTKEKKWRCC